jgi:hypothetical protein
MERPAMSEKAPRSADRADSRSEASPSSQGDPAASSDTVVGLLANVYEWTYSVADDNRLDHLAQRSKTYAWDVDTDLAWRVDLRAAPRRPEGDVLSGFRRYDELCEEERVATAWRVHTQGISNMLHGEQGALLVASQLVCCGPTHEIKRLAALQVMEEARHVELFQKYLRRHVKQLYPCSPGLRGVLHRATEDPRWDVKLLAMHLVVEGLALAAFQEELQHTTVPVLEQGLRLILRDEARHVTFGMELLADVIPKLSPAQREERGELVFEAIRSLNGDLNASGSALVHHRWPAAEVRRHLRRTRAQQRGYAQRFYARMVPDLERIGLMTRTLEQRLRGIGALALAGAEAGR